MTSEARCVTCGDLAIAARLVAILEDTTGRVELDGEVQDVALDLVDARAGDVVLVHAGVAIGVAQ